MSRRSQLVQDIIDLIGFEAAVRFFETYGGMTVYVPKGAVGAKEARNQKIRSERLAGASAWKLATKYDLHVRKIFAICRDVK